MTQPLNRPLAIVADTGSGDFHVGDEAMLEANLAALRRRKPDLKSIVIGRSSGDEERLCRRALARAGGLFISGGGNLCSSWPALVDQRLLWIREALRRGLPVVTGGQTLGPDLTVGQRAALAELLPRIDHLGVRELPSAELASELGVPRERIAYQCDDAFFLAGERPTATELPARERLESPYLAITLDLSFGLPHNRAELERIAEQLARAATEAGLHPIFVPHVGPLGGEGDEDGRVARAFRELLLAAGCACTLLPVLSPAATAWVTGHAEMVVSSRYHPLVFATAAAVPCLGIFRDPYTRTKLQGALAQVKMEAWCLSAPAAAEGSLLPGLRSLRSRRDEVRQAMGRESQRLAAEDERRWRTLSARLGLPTRAGEDGDAGAAEWRSPGRTAGTRTIDSEEQRVLTGMLTEGQWDRYSRDGFLHLGKLAEPEDLEVLKQRADDLALGKVWNGEVQMQLDTGGVYEELPAAVRRFEQGTMLYRKIQGLETDEHYSRLVKHPVCMEICARQYGAHAPISIFRAMVMNKPAGQGTVLPWHQDGGTVWALDRDPLVTVWIALDPATRTNGCMEVIPGSHRLGLLSTYGSTVRDEDVERHCLPERIHPLEVEPGHAVLLHNWLIHRSGVNPSPVPRRAFTVCYMDGRTQSVLTGNHFPLVAGSVSEEPYPYVRQLRDDCSALRALVEAPPPPPRGLRRIVRGVLNRVRRVRARLAS